MRSTSKRRWTPVEKRDTTPDVAERQRQWWLGLAPEERVAWMMDFTQAINEVRYGALRQRHPDATPAELDALWVEETYRDSLDPEFLARAADAIRARERRER